MTDFGESKFVHINNILIDNEWDLRIICNNELLKRNINSGRFIHYKIFNKDGEFQSKDIIPYVGIDFIGIDRIWLTGTKIYELEFNILDNLLQF